MAILAASSGSRMLREGGFGAAASGSSGCWLPERSDRVRRCLPSWWLLDDLIRPPQQRWRNRQAESLGSLEVDDQLELGRPFNGEVAGLGPLEDPRNVTACPVPRLVETRVVGHEPTRNDPVPRRVCGGQSLPGR